MRRGADTHATTAGRSGKPFWVTRKAARRALVSLHAAAVAAVLVELLVPVGGEGHGVERVHTLDFLGSYALYGFVACVVLVLLGRVLRRLVMRDERYYGDEG